MKISYKIKKINEELIFSLIMCDIFNQKFDINFNLNKMNNDNNEYIKYYQMK